MLTECTEIPAGTLNQLNKALFPTLLTENVFTPEGMNIISDHCYECNGYSIMIVSTNEIPCIVYKI